MKSFISFIVFVALTACSTKPKVAVQNLCDQFKSKYEQLGSPSKIILVLAPTWSSPRASLSLWDKKPGKEWNKQSKNMDVMIGRAGLGLGLDWYHLEKSFKEAPQKHEGDGKTPFGMFLLGRKFGKVPASEFKQTDNYIELNEGTMCVDDPESPYYSRIVETTKSNIIVQPNWKSAEVMFKEPFYQQGIVVDYPTSGSEKSGSCIFMHLENSAVKGTSGCIATQKVNLDKIFEFAKDNEPVMISLFTESFFKKHQECLLIN